MRTFRLALATVTVAAAVEAQSPAQAQRGMGIANIPLVFFGTQNVPNSSGNLNMGGPGWNWGGYYGAAYRSYPYLYYWGLAGQQQQNVPQGPSYANPAAVKPIDPLPPALVAPVGGANTEEWADARSSFNAASAKVSAARQAVEELRARLAAMGQSPRANLTTGVTSADSALKTAQELMGAGDLEASVREIQRANYLASQVLKEFGR